MTRHTTVRTAPVAPVPITAHATPTPAMPGLYWPSLLVGVGLMVVLTGYPSLLTTADGKADHTLASVLLFAMCAGLVRGVGFVPRWWAWRGLFSGWACTAALLLAAWLQWTR